MPANLDTVLQQALELSDEDRARLADSLLNSLDPDEDSGVEEAWAQEIQRRSREFDDGLVTPVRWREIRDSVRNQFTAHG